MPELHPAREGPKFLIEVRQEFHELSYGRALVFAISTLDLLVCFLLDFALEDSGSSRLIETSSFQDMGSINPIVTSAAHN